MAKKWREYAKLFIILFGLSLVIGILLHDSIKTIHLSRWFGNIWLYIILILLIPIFIYTLVAVVIWKVSRFETKCVPVEGYDLTDEIKEMYKEFIHLGFKPHGPPYLLIQKVTNTCVPFISENHEISGTIFINSNPLFKPSVSFDSYFEHEAGDLGTINQWYSTRISIWKNGLRQVFTEGPVALCYQKHREAINYLKLRGVKIQSLKESNPIDLCIQGFQILNQNLRKNILKVTFFYLWRKSPRNCPFFGSIVDQKIAQRQIEYILKKQSGYKG